MSETGKCAAGKYWAIFVNGDNKYISKVAAKINNMTNQIVLVYNSVECNLSKVILSQKIMNPPKCNILIIAPEGFEKSVNFAIENTCNIKEYE